MTMANKQLFQGSKGRLLPTMNTVNHEGAGAYALSPPQALAQYAATGCLGHTFYASAETQLETLLELCAKVDPRFVAKVAVYCRRQGFMKDTPALLTAWLSQHGKEYLPAVFAKVVDNGKMLRNYVQILRSGTVGRKSLGSRPKKLVQEWLNTATEAALLHASVGNDPSLADVVKMVHPKPTEDWREAWFAWLIGKPYEAEKLPPLTKAFEAWKRDRSLPLPEVPFQMLTAQELGAEEWSAIARNAGWQMLRMNLNTFARHGVFELKDQHKQIAARLADKQAVLKARVFPYQLMTAYKSVVKEVPVEVREALQDAMEVALANVPAFAGRVVVCPDVSGSMSSAVTGYRAGATSVVRCIDVAALMAAAIVRKNAGAIVLPFETRVVDIMLNPRDTVLTNAARLAAIGGGGTCCSAPLALLNQQDLRADLVVMVSDNESWVDARRTGASETLRQWERFRLKNPRAKLVCVDIQPNGHSQAAEREDILNVGGFSDEVFKMIARFAADQLSPQHWVGVIEKVTL
jgi:60 kDa SS-A/Ro ribonucleoprotein